MPCAPLLKTFGGTFVFLRNGVDLFFVLSGFLVGSILLRGDRHELPIGAFYWRRAYRILPLYYAWLAGFFVLSIAGVAGPLMADHTSPAAYTLLLQNWSYALQNHFGSDWIAITWSLCVEEHFYLVLPLLVRFVPVRILMPLLCATIVVCPALRWWLVHTGHQLSAYVLLPARADTLALGVLTAFAFRTETIRNWLQRRNILVAAVGVTAILIAFFLAWHKPIQKWAIEYSFLGISYTALLILSINAPVRWLTAILTCTPLQKAGMLAYGLYIFHQGVNFLVHWYARGGTPAIHSLATLALTGFSLILLYVVASLSWTYFEAPVLAYGRSRHPYKSLRTRTIESYSGSHHEQSPGLIRFGRRAGAE